MDASSTQLRPRPLDVPGGRVVARSRVFRYWHSSLWQVACTFSRCSVLSLCSPFVVFSQAVSWPPLSLFLFLVSFIVVCVLLLSLARAVYLYVDL